ASGAWLGLVYDVILDAITLDATHLEVAPSAATSATSGPELVHVSTHRLISNGADALVVTE
ncbi:MAG TPA: hypothetical protein VET66_07235, partial [Steroidobacteraceae bacterium]|nr:hypothetical protein [Steroidobacteraceae bacterium]